MCVNESPHEHRHRSRARPTPRWPTSIRRSGRRGLSADSHSRRFRSTYGRSRWSRSARCPSFLYLGDDQNLYRCRLRASRALSCRPRPSIPRNRGSRIRMSIARRRFCRGMRRKPDVCSRPSKSRRATCSTFAGAWESGAGRAAQRAACSSDRARVVRRRGARADGAGGA